jgi:hypothetical protein
MAVRVGHSVVMGVHVQIAGHPTGEKDHQSKPARRDKKL